MDIEFLTKKYKNKMTTLSFGGYEFYFLSEAIIHQFSPYKCFQVETSNE